MIKKRQKTNFLNEKNCKQINNFLTYDQQQIIYILILRFTAIPLAIIRQYRFKMTDVNIHYFLNYEADLFPIYQSNMYIPYISQYFSYLATIPYD